MVLPELADRLKDEGHVKLGYDQARPIRWLRSGSLVLSREVDMLSLSREAEATLIITIGFDSKRPCIRAAHGSG